MEVQRAIQAHQTARAEALGRRKKNDGWRALTRQDFDLCRVMHWTYQDLHDLPQPIYDELVAYLIEEQDAAAVSDGVNRHARRRISPPSLTPRRTASPR